MTCEEPVLDFTIFHLCMPGPRMPVHEYLNRHQMTTLKWSPKDAHVADSRRGQPELALSGEGEEGATKASGKGW